MAEVTLERATKEHARELARRMRRADREEVKASGGFTPIRAILESLEPPHGENAWSLFFDGELAAIWGVEPIRKTLLGEVRGGIVWALTTDTVERHRTAFGRVSRRILPVLLEGYPFLINMVDARYESALEWVRALGFTVSPPQPLGYRGELFHPIEIRRQACASP